MSAGGPRALAPLRHRDFRFLTGGQLASNIGDAFYAVALPWYVLATRGGVLLLGTVLAAYGVPRVALLIVGGHASDRWRPWTVMMLADALRAAVLVALALGAQHGPARAALLVPLAIALGVGDGLFLPGSMSIIPSLLPDEDLQAGNALAAGGTQVATLVGPALGGVVVATVGPATAFWIDGATFVLSAVSLAAIGRSRRALARGAESAEGGSASGGLWRFVRSQRVLQVILLVTFAANLGFGGMGEVALPALARGPLHLGAGGYGALIATFGAGALIGTILAGQVRRVRRPALLGSAVFLASAVVISATPYLPSATLSAGTLALFGVLNAFGNIVTITAFQRWAPPAMLGRLMGVLMTASFGVFPLSVLLGGVVVHAAGPTLFFPLAGVLLGLAVLAGLTQSTWRSFGVEEGEPSPLESAGGFDVEAAS